MRNSHSHPKFRFLMLVSGALVLLVFGLLVAPEAFGGCNKWNKGKDCNPNPAPTSPGTAVVMIGDLEPCLCMGAAHPRPELQFGPVECNTGADIGNSSGEYFCAVGADQQAALMTHHFPMMFNKKYRDICNVFAFDSSLVGHPDEMSFGWTEDCSDGSCAMTVNLEFSGANILAATLGESDALSVVLNGTIQTAPGGNGNPFSIAQTVPFDTMDLLFLKPGSTRLAGACTVYLDGSQLLVTEPVVVP